MGMSERRVAHHAADSALAEWLRPRGGGKLWALAAASVVVAVLLAAVGGYRLVTGSSCHAAIQLSVTAAPEIEPAVRATTAAWVATKPRVGGRCISVQVTAANPADVAAAVAGTHRATLPDLGQ